jgi:glycosyltransferase involved in cell wall biosynthesis
MGWNVLVLRDSEESASICGSEARVILKGEIVMMNVVTLLLHDERFSGWSVQNKLMRFHFSTEYLRLCRGFGWNPFLYCFHESVKEKEAHDYQGLGTIKVFPVDFRFPPFLGFANDHNPRAICKEMIYDEPSLVHYHHYYLFSFPYMGQFVKTKLDCPFTTQLHSYHNGFLMHFAFLPCIFSLKFADLIFYSYQPEEFLYKHMNLLDKAVKIPMPSIDPSLFKPDKKKDSNNLLYVGRIPFSTRTNAEKCPFSLLFLMRELVRRRKDVRLTIIGDGPGLSHCEKLAAELEIAEFVDFLGFMPRPALPEYYQKASLTLVPMELYDIDGWFDGEIQESLACGTPVAGLRTSSKTPLNGTFGFLLSKDTRKASEQVSRLLDEPEVLEDIGERGSRFVRSQCSRDRLNTTLRSSWEGLMKR